MSTLFRLLILIPAAVFFFVMAWIGIGFVGTSLTSLALNGALAAIPVALIVWTIRAHYKRCSESKFEGLKQ